MKQCFYDPISTHRIAGIPEALESLSTSLGNIQVGLTCTSQLVHQALNSVGCLSPICPSVGQRSLTRISTGRISHPLPSALNTLHVWWGSFFVPCSQNWVPVPSLWVGYLSWERLSDLTFMENDSPRFNLPVYGLPTTSNFPDMLRCTGIHSCGSLRLSSRLKDPKT